MASTLAAKSERMFQSFLETPLETDPIHNMVKKSFGLIAPFWPLHNLIAVNPLQGLESMSIEDAMITAARYFECQHIPESMEQINRETIKWLQAYFDDGQATFSMPLREQGLYSAWRQLAMYDVKLHHNQKQKKEWLQLLPETAGQAIHNCFLKLDIPSKNQETFLTLMLTTLSGWASYVKYCTEWAEKSSVNLCSITQADYLAVRLTITSLLWPEARSLLQWHEKNFRQESEKKDSLTSIEKAEMDYALPLLKKISAQKISEPHIAKVQVVFCIDARSEAFRRALESTDDYQTFGFAGFFGVPVKINDMVTGESYASCPVLLSPKHVVREFPCSQTLCKRDSLGFARLNALKRLYQSLKYTFTTPFALVESLGIMTGIWMGLRTLAPVFAAKLKLAVLHRIRKPLELEISLEDIKFPEQYAYAESALRIMGLTHHFAPLVVLCGHGSMTQNNAYATALDCGACGGRHGGNNARILAAILNRVEIKEALSKNGIPIPFNTYFIAAEHNTTTDEVTLYNASQSKEIDAFKENLEKARALNSYQRLAKLQQKGNINTSKSVVSTWSRAQDWAQIRPEWGLACNAAFIIGPRDLTAALDLQGRAFLHSYDHAGDIDGKFLTAILTAPMVVAQWINAQYFFSTLDNIAYGGGSKVTQNITGKMGVMQGNASDLMTGLPLQSVYKTDVEPYHQIQRLLTIVYAPRQLLDLVIYSQPLLQKLFSNGWVKLACVDPDENEVYFLNRDLAWTKIN